MVALLDSHCVLHACRKRLVRESAVRVTSKPIPAALKPWENVRSTLLCKPSDAPKPTTSLLPGR